MTARIYQIKAALQAWKLRPHSTALRNQWAGFIFIQSDDSIGALSPVPLQVDAGAKIEGDLPGDVPGVAAIERPVKILIGCLGRLGNAAAISVAEEERGKAVAACRCLRTYVAKADVVRVGRGRFCVELVQPGGIVALVIVVPENPVFEPELDRVSPYDFCERGVEAPGVVKCADAAA